MNRHIYPGLFSAQPNNKLPKKQNAKPDICSIRVHSHKYMWVSNSRAHQNKWVSTSQIGILVSLYLTETTIEVSFYLTQTAIKVSLHLTAYITIKWQQLMWLHDSHKQAHISLNFLRLGVIFFFFPFAGDFVGGVAAWDAAWLLVTAPGLAWQAVWLLVTAPGLLQVASALLFVGVEGTALLTETSNHGDGCFSPCYSYKNKQFELFTCKRTMVL
jgi:hypothetical protein